MKPTNHQNYNYVDNSVNWLIENNLYDYKDACSLMQKIVDSLINNNGRETVWLLQHHPVFTSGTSDKTIAKHYHTKPDAIDITASSARRKQHLIHNPHLAPLPNKIPLINTGRGGQITYHGPGQRMIYQMLDLKKSNPDVREYVENLQNWIINTLRHFDLDCFIRKDRVGIWLNVTDPISNAVSEKKIAAIGVRISRWITSHGIAINLDCDLSPFEYITPCGLEGYGVTSIQQQGKNVTMHELDQALIQEWTAIFEK